MEVPSTIAKQVNIASTPESHPTRIYILNGSSEACVHAFIQQIILGLFLRPKHNKYEINMKVMVTAITGLQSRGGER